MTKNYQLSNRLKSGAGLEFYDWIGNWFSQPRTSWSFYSGFSFILININKDFTCLGVNIHGKMWGAIHKKLDKSKNVDVSKTQGNSSEVS